MAGSAQEILAARSFVHPARWTMRCVVGANFIRH